MADHFDDLRSERYMRRYRDAECDADPRGSTALSFEDCFEMCMGTPDGSPEDSPLCSAVASSCDSSRSTSPATADDDLASAGGRSPARKRRSRTSRARRRTSGDSGSKANQCSRRNAAPPPAAQKNSPVSVVDCVAAQSSMSLDELLAFQTSKGAAAATAASAAAAAAAAAGAAAAPLAAAVGAASTAAVPQALDFSFFDSLGPRPPMDRSLAPAIAGVMDEASADPAAAVRCLLEQLRLAREDGARGITSCELNAVTYNRLVTRLMALHDLAAAAQVLDMMVADCVSFTTVHDDWVVGGRLDAAVSTLRALVRGGCPPAPETQRAVVLAWLWMGPEGLKAAAEANALMCERGSTLTPKFAEQLVHAALGRPVRRSHNSSFPRIAPAQAAQAAAKTRVLEEMLVQLFESPCVHFQDGALAALLRTLEACGAAAATAHTGVAARRLCEVVRLLCERVPGRQPCIRSVGTFLRLMLRERRFAAAVALLRTLRPGQGHPAAASVDGMFLTSALHAVAAAAVSPEAHGDGAATAPASLLDATRALCELAAAAAPAVRVSYSVLNQTLNTLRALNGQHRHALASAGGGGSTADDDGVLLREAAAVVGAALFKGLHRLHAKAVNRRTFDRLFELLLATTGKRQLSDDVLTALRHVHTAAAVGGFALAPETAERLAALGIVVAVPAATPRRPSRAAAASLPIDIETIMPRSPSSDKPLFALADGGGGSATSHSAPRPRIAFELCNRRKSDC